MNDFAPKYEAWKSSYGKLLANEMKTMRETRLRSSPKTRKGRGRRGEGEAPRLQSHLDFRSASISTYITYSLLLQTRSEHLHDSPGIAATARSKLPVPTVAASASVPVASHRQINSLPVSPAAESLPLRGPSDTPLVAGRVERHDRAGREAARVRIAMLDRRARGSA